MLGRLWLALPVHSASADSEAIPLAGLANRRDGVYKSAIDTPLGTVILNIKHLNGTLSVKGISHMQKLLGLGVSCLLATAVFAQNTSFTGFTTDPASAVVAEASITVTNTATGLQRDAKSDAQGRYGISELPPGNYRLNAKAAGFSEAVINNIVLQVNQPANVVVKFQLGATSTTVSVEATSRRSTLSMRRLET